MINAIQQQTTNNGPRNQISLNSFMRHTPPKFNGKGTLDEVDAWIQENEKIFWVIACPEE